jgi:hypothetical protein
MAKHHVFIRGALSLARELNDTIVCCAFTQPANEGSSPAFRRMVNKSISWRVANMCLLKGGLEYEYCDDLVIWTTRYVFHLFENHELAGEFWDCTGWVYALRNPPEK